MSRWAKASMLEKRISGFFTYLLAAFSALIWPIEVDLAMLDVLKEQFKDTQMTTTPTSGAADLPEALRPVEPVALIASIQELNAWEARADGELLTQAEGESIILVLHELKRLLALAAGQATAAPAQPAAQQGVADGFFLLLPQRPKPEAPAGTVGLDWDAYSGAQMLAFGRDSSDAAIAALRTEQPAPSGATEEVENLRKALVYAAFALHDAPQYMLAQGITLIDGDTVRVSRDGWTVEASVNPHRQPAPATQQAGEVRRAELVPGVMHCAKCKFQLNRVTLCVSDGNAYAGNNKTEPCPNGCGPLWPVTWEQEAKNCWKALEEMHERLMAAAAPHTSPTAQADSVLDDAAREAIEKVLALFPFNVPIQKFTVNNGPCLTADNDDEFYSVKRVLAFLTEIKTTLDAARKQGGAT